MAKAASFTTTPSRVFGKILPAWTEVKRVVRPEGAEPFVKQTVCCCSSPGDTRRACAGSRHLKHPCRCYCHQVDA